MTEVSYPLNSISNIAGVPNASILPCRVFNSMRHTANRQYLAMPNDTSHTTIHITTRPNNTCNVRAMPIVVIRIVADAHRRIRIKAPARWKRAQHLIGHMVCTWQEVRLQAWMVGIRTAIDNSHHDVAVPCLQLPSVFTVETPCAPLMKVILRGRLLKSRP